MNRATENVYSHIGVLNELRAALAPEDCAILQRTCRAMSQNVVIPALEYGAYITELAKRNDDFSNIKRAKYRAIHIFNGAIVGGSTELCKMAVLWDPNIMTLTRIQRGIRTAAPLGNVNICMLLLDYAAKLPNHDYIMEKLVERGTISRVVSCAIDADRGDAVRYVICNWVAEHCPQQRTFFYQWPIAHVIAGAHSLGILRELLEWAIREYHQGGAVNFGEIAELAIYHNNHEAFRIICTRLNSANIAIDYVHLARCVIAGNAFNNYTWELILHNLRRSGQRFTIESVLSSSDHIYCYSTTPWWSSDASLRAVCKWIQDTAQTVDWCAISEWARRTDRRGLSNVAARLGCRDS